MGVQGVSISQNTSCKSLNINHLTAIMQYKWDHKLEKAVATVVATAFSFVLNTNLNTTSSQLHFWAQ